MVLKREPRPLANCSRKNIPRANLFVGPLTGGSSYSEGVGSNMYRFFDFLYMSFGLRTEILIFTPPLSGTLCMCELGWCSPILGVPTQWVNANGSFDF